MEQAVFRGHKAQGEVMLRLALERLEAMVGKQLAVAEAPPPEEVIRTHGLLRVVRKLGAVA